MPTATVRSGSRDKDEPSDAGTRRFIRVITRNEGTQDVYADRAFWTEHELTLVTNDEPVGSFNRADVLGWYFDDEDSY